MYFTLGYLGVLVPLVERFHEWLYKVPLYIILHINILNHLQYYLRLLLHYQVEYALKQPLHLFLYFVLYKQYHRYLNEILIVC